MLHLHTVIYDSFYDLCGYMVKWKFTFNFGIFLLPLYLKFSNNGVNFVSFLDDIEVSSSQLKRFDESVIDPECLLKIAATSFCLITFHLFQATLYFLVYYYFYLRSTIHMLSKMVWNYNQHKVSHSTEIWLIYSDLPTGFVVT